MNNIKNLVKIVNENGELEKVEVTLEDGTKEIVAKTDRHIAKDIAKFVALKNYDKINNDEFQNSLLEIVNNVLKVLEKSETKTEETDKTLDDKENDDENEKEDSRKKESNKPSTVVYGDYVNGNKYGQTCTNCKVYKEKLKNNQKISLKKEGPWKNKLSGILVGISLLAAGMGIGHHFDSIAESVSKLFNKESFSTSDGINQELTVDDYSNINVKYSEEELNKMSFTELSDVYKKYNDNFHNDIFNLLESTQNYMNETAFPSIKLPQDEDRQLYLKANEVIGTFVMVNADNYEDKIINLLGNSGLLNSENINENYIQTSRIMNIYYSRATKRSGISNLFLDQEDQLLVNEFEDLIIANNNSNTQEEKNIASNNIREFLNNLIDVSKIDGAMNKNKGAVSYILMNIGYVDAYTNLTEEEINNLININQVVTCDNQYNQVKLMENKIDNKTMGIYRAVKEESRAMDLKNVKNMSRDNINWGIYDNSSIKNQENNYGYSNKSNTQKETSRDEAVSLFGESTVVSKENEAKQEIENENKNQNEYDNGFSAGYNAVCEKSYLQAASNGTKYSFSYNSDGSAYGNGYADGILKGINAGYDAGMVEYNYKQNLNPSITEVKETPVTEEDGKDGTEIKEGQFYLHGVLYQVTEVK